VRPLTSARSLAGATTAVARPASSVRPGGKRFKVSAQATTNRRAGVPSPALGHGPDPQLGGWGHPRLSRVPEEKGRSPAPLEAAGLDAVSGCSLRPVAVAADCPDSRGCSRDHLPHRPLRRSQPPSRRQQALPTRSSAACFTSFHLSERPSPSGRRVLMLCNSCTIPAARKAAYEQPPARVTHSRDRRHLSARGTGSNPPSRGAQRFTTQHAVIGEQRPLLPSSIRASSNPLGDSCSEGSSWRSSPAPSFSRQAPPMRSPTASSTVTGIPPSGP
jgi:hypothetical protein